MPPGVGQEYMGMDDYGDEDEVELKIIAFQVIVFLLCTFFLLVDLIVCTQSSCLLDSVVLKINRSVNQNVFL